MTIPSAQEEEQVGEGAGKAIPSHSPLALGGAAELCGRVSDESQPLTKGAEFAQDGPGNGQTGSLPTNGGYLMPPHMSTSS